MKLCNSHHRSLQKPSPEFWRFLLEGIVLCIALDWLFYKNPWFLLPLFGILPFFIRYRKAETDKKRRKKLAYDFKEALNGLSVALRAGYSPENAFSETEAYLKQVLGKKNQMTREICRINRGIYMNQPLEQLLRELALRTEIEDIRDFSSVFSTGVRSGGNLPELITKTALRLEGKIEIEQEIAALLAAKKLEQRIMSLMPFAIILYMNLTSPEFLSPMYHNLPGVLGMTAALLAYGAAFALGTKIVNIEV